MDVFDSVWFSWRQRPRGDNWSSHEIPLGLWHDDRTFGSTLCTMGSDVPNATTRRHIRLAATAVARLIAGLARDSPLVRKTGSQEVNTGTVERHVTRHSRVICLMWVLAFIRIASRLSMYMPVIKLQHNNLCRNRSFPALVLGT